MQPRLAPVAIGLLFIAAGAMHFVRPDMYARIVPPGLGPPRLLVAISGIAEIAGGVGVLVPRLRRPAGWGLIALLVCVFPANLYMAFAADRFRDVPGAPWSLWLRLPLQPLLIAWVWRSTIRARHAR
jgi:uncharacterized membrane protein